MKGRVLDDHERCAIEDILNTAEKSYTKGTTSHNLQDLDDRCRGIWPDWEFTVQPGRETPKPREIIATDESSISKASPREFATSFRSSLHDSAISASSLRESVSIRESPKEPHRDVSVLRKPALERPSESESVVIKESSVIRDSHADLRDVNHGSGFRHTSQRSTRFDEDSSGDSDEIGRYRDADSDEESDDGERMARRRMLRKPKSAKRTVQQRKGVSAKGVSKAMPSEPFARSDTARLRQENLELRTQIARLQNALGREQCEITKMKEELQKARSETNEQRATITFLKDKKLRRR